MRVSDFSFDLPDDLIAQEPTPDRTASRLMVIPRHGDVSVSHTTFAHLADFLRRGDVLVVNRTRVLPARMFATRADGVQFEVFFLSRYDDRHFIAWAKPGKKLRPGNVLEVLGGGRISFIGRERGDRVALFDVDAPDTVDTLLERSGHVPLPPYITRADQGADRERYQTVFARETGSVAAPTAGLHFDDALLASLREHGVRIVEITLHVGPGTFQPLFDEVVENNRLHAETFSIGAATLSEVALAKREQRRVIAVGTTVTRTLEYAVRQDWLKEPFQDHSGETDLFLYPGADFRVVNGLITNFHLPRSSLLMLVCAFMGTERALACYRDAVARGYRFFSYGDAMFIS